MEDSTKSPARVAERMLFYGWMPVFVLALWPYTTNPCEPPKLLATAVLLLGCSALAFFGTDEKSGGRDTGAPRGAGLGVLLALWLGWQLLCGLRSGLPTNSLWSLTLPAAWVLAALAARRAFAGPDTAWRLAAVMVASLVAASAYGFMQHFGWDPFPWSSTTTVEYRGLPSSFGNPNFAGHALVPGIILALMLATGRRLRVLALAAALLMAAHLWFTGMRGGPVALAAAAVLAAAWRVAGLLRGPRPGRVALALLLTAVMGAGAAVAAAVVFRATHGTWVPLSDSSLVLRYNSAHGAARMALDHPLTGVGPGNYERYVADWWTPFEQRWYALRGLRNDHVHCEPLEAAAETGLPGLVLHFLLFSWALLAGLRLAANGVTPGHRRLGLAVALCVFAMGVDGLFGFNLHVPVSSGLFFVLLGVLDGVAGGMLSPRSRRGLFRAFMGPVLAMALAAVVLAGVLGRFRADSSALQAQGMREQLAALSPADPGRPALQDEFLQQLAKCRRQFPVDPRFSEIMGRVCLVGGYFEAAEGAFSAALSNYPANPDTWANLAKALHGQAAARAGIGDWPGTVFLLQRAAAAAEHARNLCPPLAAPHDALWRIADLRAEAARRLGADCAAQDRLVRGEGSLALQAGVMDTVSVYRTLVRVALRGENPDEAVQYLVRALDAAPNTPETWVLLERVYAAYPENPLLLDAVSRAYGTLKKAERPGSAFLEAAWWLTKMHLSTFPDLALAVARDAIMTCPDAPGAWGLLALFPQDQTPLLERLCGERKNLSAGAHDEGVIPELIRALCSQPPADSRRLEQAARAFSAAAAGLGGPNLPERVRREYCWALPLLKEAAQKCGAGPVELLWIYGTTAGIYCAAEMWPETETACRDALSHADPETGATLNMLLSNALARLGRRDEALAAARLAVQTAPGRMDIQWNLAQRLAELGVDREAQFVYKRLLGQLPSSAPEYGRVVQEYARVQERLQAGASGGAP